MKKAHILAAGFEAVTVFILLSYALWPAFSHGVAVLVPLMHGIFLLGCYLIAHHVLSLWHRYAGRFLFVMVTLVLIFEITVHHVTTLHINRFVLSLLAQPQALDQIGLSPALIVLLGAGMVAVLVLPTRIFKKTISLPLKQLLAITGMALLLSQGLYALLLHQRDMGLITSQRHLVFFTGLHRYYAEKLFTPLFGPPPPNPFARSYDGEKKSRPSTTKWKVTTPKNLLLVVIDSLRAKDIQNNPALAPNLLRWGETGYLSLEQNSVSNCTHFSMHTLLTSELATSFASSRYGNKAVGMFAALSGNGYRMTSAEALSLDWYDIAHTYMPGVTRYIAQGEEKGDKDKFVTEKTLTLLDEKSNIPWAHLAYFTGPHFFYDYNESVTTPNYQEKIKETDALVGQMLDRLKEQGALENTLVIVTSDHGEQLPGEGPLGHGSVLNEAQTTVPLLIWGADTPTGWIRSHRDIMPFVRAEVGAAPLRTQADPKLIMAGCDYEFPNSFAVIDGDDRIDFRFEDGLLWPVWSKDDVKPDPQKVKKVKEASMVLINLFQQSDATP